MDISKIVQEIQYVLAPAIMISSAGMLLLGFQTKFSNLASRFRGLNHERQQLARLNSRSREEELRFESLKHQSESIFRRASLVKNAIFLTYGSIAFFAGASVMILLSMHAISTFYPFIIVTFAIGILLLFASAFVMLAETQLLFQALTLEKKSWS